ncbi:putative leader peptide [Streptomyces sp. NPDC055722]
MPGRWSHTRNRDGDQGVVTGRCARRARRARHTEVTDVTHAPRTVRLHSRPHIDLLRVAGALCRS